MVRRIAVVPNSSVDSPVSAPRPSSGRRTAPENARGARTGQVASTEAAQQVASAGEPEPRAARRTPVRPHALGPSLTVARWTTAPVRRITALRPAVRPAGPAAAPAVDQDAAPTPAVQRAASPARPGSRPPLGEPLAELPATARPLPAGAPETTGPATAPELPILQRRTDTATTASTPQPQVRPSPAGTPDTTSPATAPTLPILQRQTDTAASTPQPLERPSPAGTPGTTGPATGPTLPIVQRQTDTAASTPEARRGAPATPRSGGTPTAEPVAKPDPARPATGPRPSGARARGGLGAPLPAMPQTADMPRPAGPGGRPVAPAGPSTPATPHVQRTPLHPDRPAGGAPERPSGPPRPEGTAPLLGGTDVARRGSTPDSRTDQGVSPSVPDSAPAPATALATPGAAPDPATPLVTPGAPQSVPSAAPEPDAVQRLLAPRTRATTTDGPRVPASTGTTATSASGNKSAAPARSAPGGAPPVVVARAVTVPAPAPGRSPDTSGNRPPGVIDTHPLTAQRRPTHRSLSLLPARPLTVSTRVPEGFTPPAAARTAERPVVSASWRREPSPGQGPVPAAPHVQRNVSAPAPPASGNPPARSTSSVQPRRAVPVVRPNPPVQRAAPVHPQALPVTDPQASPLQDRPVSPAQHAAPPVPVVRATRTTAHGPHSASSRAASVQRQATGAGAGAGARAVPPGVPVTAVPSRTVQRTPSAPAVAGRPPGRDTAGSAGVPQDSGIDLDELARRLLEPMARLLRADLRRGRERTGRPYDGRR
ncbi:hypothetical protein [Streptomyces broussonetiae]|uniref:hypothetical protein n=1 Tax=Streptomyces broussonetiae TaxID=2686304 RepID=UPI0035DFB1A9